MPSFNVLSEPWIPASDLRTGKVAERGILGTLQHAHELVEIVDPSPLIRFGLYRLLIAFALDALQIRELCDIEDLLEKKRFDQDAFERYADGCGRNRFDLFDQERPFLQAERNPERDKGKNPVSRLFQHFPCGTNAIFFHHHPEDGHAIAPPACARVLTAIAPFMTAGGAGFSPSINGAPPRYALITGASLFERIVLNCCAIALPCAGSDAPVAWRSTSPVIPRECSQYSLLEALTWQPRRVRLIPDGGGVCTYTGKPADTLVREVSYSPAAKATGGWVDPQVAYRISDKGRGPLRMQEDRSAWRDLAPLTLLREADYESPKSHMRFERALIVHQFELLCRDGILSRDTPLELEICECRTDNMKIFEWNKDRLTLPTPLLLREGSGRSIQEAIEQAELAAYFLGKALKKAFPRDGKSNAKAFDNIIISAQRSFWDNLRSRFDEFILNLTRTDSGDLSGLAALASNWQGRVRQQALDALNEALGPLDANADALQRQVAAQEDLARNLGKALPSTVGQRNPPDKKLKRKSKKGEARS